ncbi:MAG: hypothetical protein HQL02_12180 [Nitrospirae bacterium]|nr:hypothetical protein [Nitrospirota bacterium]
MEANQEANQKEWDRKMEANQEANQKEWDRRMEANQEANQKEWDRRMEAMEKKRLQDKEEWDKKWEANQKEWDRKQEARQREWDKKQEARQREWNKKWGETANRLGTLVEDVVAPNIEGLAYSYFGCKRIDLFAPRIKRTSRRDRSMLREFDCIAICDELIIVSDTKTTPTVDKVNSFIEVLKDIFDYFPEAEGKRVIPIFSSLYLTKDLVTYLTRQDIYALGMGSSTMELLNEQEIKERMTNVRT